MYRLNSTCKACCLADALQVPHVLTHVGVTTIERLDQSHLYPNLEVAGLGQLGIEPGPPAWETSTLEKSHPDSLLIAFRNIYMSPRQNKYFCSTSYLFYVVWNQLTPAPPPPLK